MDGGGRGEEASGCLPRQGGGITSNDVPQCSRNNNYENYRKLKESVRGRFTAVNKRVGEELFRISVQDSINTVL